MTTSDGHLNIQEDINFSRERLSQINQLFRGYWKNFILTYSKTYSKQLSAAQLM